MKDLRQEQTEIKTHKSTAYYLKKFAWARNLKLAKYALIAFGAYLFIFQPVLVGSVIGTWIHDFFGALFQKAKF